MHIGRAGSPPLIDEARAAQDFSGRIERIVFELGDDGDADARPGCID